MGHRYYDPATGRFISQDPAQDDRNWYAYCGNNPLVAVDPEGQVPILVEAAAVVAVYEIASAVADGVNTVQTLTDPKASNQDKFIATAGFGASLALPGGGYGTAAKVAKEALPTGLKQASSGLQSIFSGGSVEK